jgi:hypothetical protein
MIYVVCVDVVLLLLYDKVCQWLVTGRWFSSGPPVSPTNKTDHHDITDILLKVALITINPTNQPTIILLSIYELLSVTRCVFIYIRPKWLSLLWLCFSWRRCGRISSIHEESSVRFKYCQANKKCFSWNMAVVQCDRQVVKLPTSLKYLISFCMI